jgi:hypothetical protein
MVKPFDLEDLQERLKAKGLASVEGLAEIVAVEVFGWLEESCLLHDNVLVKTLGVPAVQILKPMAMGAINKIDGEEG